MIVTVDHLNDILRAPKELAQIPVGWSESKRVTHVTMSIFLGNRSGEATLEGVNLRGTCIKEFPDRAVTFQLDYTAPSGPTYPIVRYDWRDLGSHSNRALGPDRTLHGLVFRGTHVHLFEINQPLGVDLMRASNLPLAIGEEDPPNFHALLKRIATIMHIGNAHRIPEPKWQPRLHV